LNPSRKVLCLIVNNNILKLIQGKKCKRGEIIMDREIGTITCFKDSAQK
jgi:hypothetical protein